MQKRRQRRNSRGSDRPSWSSGKREAQVSTEYLVVLAIVMVVVLVVAYLAGGSSSLGSGALLTQNKQYWAGQYPLAITISNAWYSGGIGGTNHVQLEVINRGVSQISLSFILAQFPGGSINWIGSSQIAPGQSKTFDLMLVAGPVACTSPGLIIKYDILFGYSLQSVNGVIMPFMKQYSKIPLMLKCS
jgi:hypothetical protein